MHNNQTLRQNISDFIVYKRALGYLYDAGEMVLNHYATFTEKNGYEIHYPEKNITAEYLGFVAGAEGTLYRTVSVLREFSRFLQARGCTEAYLIPPKTVVSHPVAEDPYFFMKEEIEAFFEQLDNIEPNKSFKGREYVFPALFRILYCCGLRCKEARTLECSNVHIEELFIDVIQSKGPKSRRIFVSQELADYLIDYDKKISVLFPGRRYYFPYRSGDRCYGTGAVSNNFKRFWKRAYPDFEMKTRPRAYDFRHHFAWANLNRWAKDGLDLNAMLPYLMRYMGHQTVNETLYYFHFVPEFFPTYRDMASPLAEMIPEVPNEE